MRWLISFLEKTSNSSFPLPVDARNLECQRIHPVKISLAFTSTRA